MKFVSDPPISEKINRMKERVQWQNAQILARGIDQTRFVMADGNNSNPEFSFLVMGDSGSSLHQSHHPQRQVALKMIENQGDARFIIHTGDVVYQVGSREYYQENFIKPYREFICGGDRPEDIPYDKMVFKLPILPVLGNHDYYDLPFLSSLAVKASLPIRLILGLPMELNFGWHGSDQGDTYARAFLDYLRDINNPEELGEHLDRHYHAVTNTGRCLVYQPEKFTRLPNRYYTFRYGGIDFFALDSNTFNSPAPLPDTKEGDNYREILKKRRDNLEQEELQLWETSSQINREQPKDQEQLEELQTEIQQIEEVKLDIDKQLEADKPGTVDFEQLNWLRQRLIESLFSSEVRGRVIYFHHPPYVTESSKWDQAQTLAVRQNLRWVFNQVATTVGDKRENRPLVDLILSGHAHCLEYIKTVDTGHADSNLNWIICGGSGYSLRRQRSEGGDLRENTLEGNNRLVARSQLFLGKNNYLGPRERPYSALKIQVQGDRIPKFILQPLVAERLQGQWRDRPIKAFEI